MTQAEKILARASGREEVSPGETVAAAVDLAASPANAKQVCRRFLAMGGEAVWDPDRIAIVLEHLAPRGDGAVHKSLREFAREQGLRHFYDVGRGGVCHQVMAESGHVLPGMLVVGTSPHTTIQGAFGALALEINAKRMAAVWKAGRLAVEVPSTIRIEVSGAFREWISAKDLVLGLTKRLGEVGSCRSLEFDGPAIAGMSISSRMVLMELGRNAGAVAAFAPVDDTLLEYLTRAAGTPMAFSPRWAPDPDASYTEVIPFDVHAELREPQVRRHGKTGGVVALSKLVDRRVDMAVVGSCSNGRMEDLAVAAGVLAGRSVHAGTRLLVIPASQQVYLDALRHGYLQALAAAGAAILPPGCGAATSVRHGMLAAGETCISTTSCSYDARETSARQRVYEASPAVVAAAAAAGRMVHPEDVVEEDVA
jgi:3-isopropylmalate/(R)-2-methylmalate dehydratase large subunit